MKIMVVGSKNWVDYNEVMRVMTVTIDRWVSTNPEDKVITFVHSGSVGAENMVTEYIGKVEKFMRQKDYHIKEKLYSRSNYGNPGLLARDYDILTSGVDKAIVFIRDRCKRSESFINMAKADNIPVELVKG